MYHLRRFPIDGGSGIHRDKQGNPAGNGVLTGNRAAVYQRNLVRLIGNRVVDRFVEVSVFRSIDLEDRCVSLHKHSRDGTHRVNIEGFRSIGREVNLVGGIIPTDKFIAVVRHGDKLICLGRVLTLC